MEFASHAGRVVRLDGLVLTLLFVSLTGNVYLGVTRNSTAPATAGLSEFLAVGSRAPEFRGINRAGETVRLDYARSN